MLTLCLRKLAANVTKFSALSNGGGQVHIAWELK
jgi:two-component sensor histidine kinase